VSRVLLDVNVLLALLDTDHVDHDRARDWLDGVVADGWASCPITQNGFVRIISQPRYPSPVSPAVAADLLDRATATALHRFWPCEVSLLDPDAIDRTRLHGPRQVTDAYLLATATSRGGRFATFDRHVVLSAVPSATADNLVIV
jgi:uncharacterized protein